jgi:hypothetical protein
MTNRLNVAMSPGEITVATEAFTLVFSKESVGITSFRYELNGVWHECVAQDVDPGILFGPQLVIDGVPGGAVYPRGGLVMSLDKDFGWLVEITQSGYLRNGAIPSSTDFTYQATWRIWPSGRLVLKTKVKNESGSAKTISEDGFMLNPSGDSDIYLDRDTAPDLNWFGFYSNNPQGGKTGHTHDAIVVPYTPVYDHYAVSNNTNRIYRTGVNWDINQILGRHFLIGLSVFKSWGDCMNAPNFQIRGDKLSSDYQNPDPLDGSFNAGDVLAGSLITDGFSEEYGAYTLLTE